MKDLNLDVDIMSILEIKNKVGNCFVINKREIDIFNWTIDIEEWDDYFEKGNDPNVIEINDLDFIFNFLNKKYKNCEIEIREELMTRNNYSLRGESAYINIEEAILDMEKEIEKMIFKVIAKNTLIKKEKNFFNHFLKNKNDEEEKKIDFIVKNHNIFKGNLYEFLNVKIKLITIKDIENKEVIVPIFIKNNNEYEEYNIYSINGNNIICKSIYLKNCYFCDNYDSLNFVFNIRNEYESIYIRFNKYNNKFFIEKYDFNNEFFIKKNDIYLKEEDAKIDINKKIKEEIIKAEEEKVKMEEEIIKMEKHIECLKIKYSITDLKF